MKTLFAALALTAAMVGATAAYACKDDCDCAGKKAPSTATTPAAPAVPATPAQPAPGH
jgi:hypothetical protein